MVLLDIEALGIGTVIICIILFVFVVALMIYILKSGIKEGLKEGLIEFKQWELKEKQKISNSNLEKEQESE